jgi:hypothetical protein
MDVNDVVTTNSFFLFCFFYRQSFSWILLCFVCRDLLMRDVTTAAAAAAAAMERYQNPFVCWMR